MAREETEIKELSKKLAQNPDSMVFVQLADAYRRSGDLEKSVEVCLQGLERHPTYSTARSILGRNYLDLGKLDEAASEFRQIEVADPDNIMAHRMLGQIYLDKGQYAEAIARQQKVLALDPDDTTAQELLQEALKRSKQGSGAQAAAAPAAPAPAVAKAAQAQASAEQLGTLKVAEIYIKKGAFDEAAEVLQEILASDPSNTLAQQKLKEVNERRGVSTDSGEAAAKKAAEEAAAKKAAEEAAAKKAAEEAAAKKAAEEAAAKKAAEEAAAKKAAEEAAAKKAAEEAAAKKAAEEAAAKKAAEEAAAKKAAEEATAKKAAEEAAAKKAAEEAAAKKAAEEAAAKKAAEEEAAAKKAAEEEAAAKKAAEEAAAKKAAEEEAAKKAAEDAAAKKAEEEAAAKKAAAEAAAKKAADEERERKASKLSSEDILSVMAGSSEELIEDEAPAKAPAQATPAAPPKAVGLDPATKSLLDDFIKAQAIEASLLLDPKGGVLDSRNADANNLGATAFTIFNNTEKAAQRMQFGGLRQIMIVGEDNRQILFVALKAGVLVAITGRNTNLGLLRVAVNDLVKRA